MSQELAKVEDLAAEIARVRELAAWVESAPAADAADLADKADQARRLVIAMKGAAELAREATRLECLALRRLGQLGCDRDAGKRAHIAREFASMPDAAFAAMLDAARPNSGAWGVYKMHRAEQTKLADVAYGRSVASGRRANTVDPTLSLSELTEAAGALLDEYAASSQLPFALGEIADEIADDLGLTSCNAAMRAGLVEAVRLAIQQDNLEADPDPNAPTWVSYNDGALGWVRVPFQSASLAQFTSMVEFRREQASQMAAVVKRLEGVLERVEASAPLAPDAGCGELLRLSYQSMAVAS